MFSSRKLGGIDLWPPSYDVVFSTLAAGVVSYVVYRTYTNWQHKSSLWRYINKLREQEQQFRAQLREKLEADAEKWVQISRLPFDELVGKLQSGELKAVETLHAYQYAALVATEKANAVTAFVRNAEEFAEKLDQSTGPKKPLHGVPFSMKDAFYLKGTESTGGLAYFLGKSVDKENAPFVDFLIEQGCVPFIKTNIPQAMLTMDSRNAIYGITRNPNDLTRSPGGSSSGEAAILNMRGSIIGMGSDIGGSVRIPTAWCGGCVSLKPTAQRTFLERGGPDTDEFSRLIAKEMVTYGFMTRDMSSLSTLHRLFYSSKTFSVLPKLAPLPFRDEIYKSSKPLRIGYYTNLPGTVETVPAVRRAIFEAKAMLEARGHQLVEFEPLEPDYAWVLMISLLFADGGDGFNEALYRDVEIAYPNRHLIVAALPIWLRWLYAKTLGRQHGPYAERCVYAMTACKTPSEMNSRYHQQLVYQEKFITAFRNNNLDALLCPCAPCPAIPLDSTREMTTAIYTALFNLLNWPAGVITISSVTKEDEDAMADYPGRDLVHKRIKDGLTPSETTSSSIGLPLAVQIACPWFCEEMVLRVMRELEEAVTSTSNA